MRNSGELKLNPTSICYILPNRQVVFYDTSGRTLQTFDYSGDDGVREFTACAFNPSGDAVVFGTYNRFYVYVHNAGRNVWEQVCVVVCVCACACACACVL